MYVNYRLEISFRRFRYFYHRSRYVGVQRVGCAVNDDSVALSGSEPGDVVLPLSLEAEANVQACRFDIVSPVQW